MEWEIAMTFYRLLHLSARAVLIVAAVRFAPQVSQWLKEYGQARRMIKDEQREDA